VTSEAGKLMYPLAARVFYVKFICCEKVTKLEREDPILAGHVRNTLAVIGGMTCWHHQFGYRVLGIEEVDTIENQPNDGIVETLLLAVQYHNAI
jgi:hypothetical protein